MFHFLQVLLVLLSQNVSSLNHLRYIELYRRWLTFVWNQYLKNFAMWTNTLVFSEWMFTKLPSLWSYKNRDVSSYLQSIFFLSIAIGYMALFGIWIGRSFLLWRINQKLYVYLMNTTFFFLNKLRWHLKQSTVFVFKKLYRSLFTRVFVTIQYTK